MTESWTRRVERSDYIEVGWFCPRQPYLEIQVPEDATSVRRLVITTVSHDQGFSDHAPFHGTYESTCSFFEVTVVTSELHERAIARHFQNNVHASREARKHVNMWDVREGLTDADQEWISCFRAGDFIQVIPGAEFLGWTNHVYEVSIEIEGEKQKLDLNETTSHVDDNSLCYQPLDRAKREVRMLLLHSGANAEMISCDISTVSLDSSVESYVALSYCWGNPDRRKVIHVQDSKDAPGTIQELKVNNNLYEALRHLASGITEPIWIWADAVCINQDDLDERSQQVTLIQAIYKEAHHVMVWLGPSNETRKACFAAIRDVEDRFQQQLDRSKTYTSDELDHMCLEFWIEKISGEPCMEMSREWRRSDFDWFNRTWVLQEIVNAKSATVRCGDDILSWAVVSRFADAIRIHKQRAPLIRYGIMPSIFLNMTNYDGTGKEDVDILEVLIQTLSLKASDRRDRIFAMLQFGVETRDLTKLPLSIRPDYGKTVQRVFTDFVRWWICEHKSLRVLSMIHALKGRSWQQMYYGRPTDLESLTYPSWSFWYGGHVSWATGTLALTPNSPYRASGSSLPDTDLILSAQALINHDILQVRGYRMGDVWQVSKYDTGRPHRYEEWANTPDDHEDDSEANPDDNNEDDQEGVKNETRKEKEDKTADVREANPDEEVHGLTGNEAQRAGATDQVDQSVVTEADRSSRSIKDGEALPVNDAQATFENIYNPNGSSRTWIWDKDDQIIQKMNLNQEVQWFYAHLQYHQDGFEGSHSSFPCYSRCRMAAFTPTDGLLHGLVPHLARPGDVVVLLNGGSVFYLLRESKKHVSTKTNGHDTSSINEVGSETKQSQKKWLFVGECFLDDRMNGEALKEIADLNIAEEVFDLV